MSTASQLGAEITELCSYIYAAESRLLTLIREFDEKQYWAGQGLCSCAHWLNLKCGIGMNAAREKVRVAHALAELPKISEGFSSGTLSYSKVRAMTRIADETNEDYLLMIAEHGTAHHVEKLVSKFRTAKRLQDAEVANEQYTQREMTHYYDHDGCLVIKARLPAEQGALIVKALEMAMDQSFAGADPVRDNDDSAEEREPIAARRADALAEVAETYMNNSESSGSTADRYQVVVHVAAEPNRACDALARGRHAADCHLEDGPGVYPEGTLTAVTSRRIACDSSIVTIKEDENGEPLSIGRRSRCRHHHHLVHEGGFICEKSSDGNIDFKDQRQQILEPFPVMPGVAANDDVQQWLDREFFEENIDGETCAARRYAGERMDWNAAVSALF